MDGKRVLALTGGAAAFAGVVAVGAVTIVSLMPGERIGASGENALLMERPASLKPFDAPSQMPAIGPAREPIRGTGAAGRLLPPLSDGPPPLATEETSAVEAAAPIPPPLPTSPVQSQPSPAPPIRREAARPRVAKEAAAEITPPPSLAAPAPPPLPRKPPEPAANGVLTPAEIRRIKLSLRLTPEQQPYWYPVEQMLLDIGAQQTALVRAGQNPSDAFGIGAAMRMSSVARPLLDVLREDQKVQVRARARAMGFGSVASQI